MQRSFELGSLRPKPRCKGLELADGNRLSDLVRVIEEGGFEGAFLEEVELHVGGGRGDEVP